MTDFGSRPSHIPNTTTTSTRPPVLNIPAPPPNIPVRVPIADLITTINLNTQRPGQPGLPPF